MLLFTQTPFNLILTSFNTGGRGDLLFYWKVHEQRKIGPVHCLAKRSTWATWSIWSTWATWATWATWSIWSIWSTWSTWATWSIWAIWATWATWSIWSIWSTPNGQLGKH